MAKGVGLKFIINNLPKKIKDFRSLKIATPVLPSPWLSPSEEINNLDEVTKWEYNLKVIRCHETINEIIFCGDILRFAGMGDFFMSCLDDTELRINFKYCEDDFQLINGEFFKHMFFYKPHNRPVCYFCGQITNSNVGRCGASQNFYNNHTEFRVGGEGERILILKCDTPGIEFHLNLDKAFNNRVTEEISKWAVTEMYDWDCEEGAYSSEESCGINNVFVELIRLKFTCSMHMRAVFFKDFCRILV